MNARNIALLIVAGAAAALVVRQLRAGAPQSGAMETHGVNTDAGHKRLSHIVEKTLHQHEGEESPLVQAFAEALETEKPSHEPAAA